MFCLYLGWFELVTVERESAGTVEILFEYLFLKVIGRESGLVSFVWKMQCQLIPPKALLNLWL